MVNSTSFLHFHWSLACTPFQQYPPGSTRAPFSSSQQQNFHDLYQQLHLYWLMAPFSSSLPRYGHMSPDPRCETPEVEVWMMVHKKAVWMMVHKKVLIRIIFCIAKPIRLPSLNQYKLVRSSFKMDNSLEKTLFHLFWDILFATELDIGCHRLASPSFSAWKCCPAIENTFSDFFGPFSESPYEEKGLQLGNLIMTSMLLDQKECY